MNTLEDNHLDTYFYDNCDAFAQPLHAFPHSYFDYDNGAEFFADSNSHMASHKSNKRNNAPVLYPITNTTQATDLSGLYIPDQVFTFNTYQ